MSLLLPMPWLTEERPDKTRRRRLCLGCGESFEYPVKSVPAVSLVSWIKAHLPCGEFYRVPPSEAFSAAAQPSETPPPGVPPYPKDLQTYPKEWDGWSIGDECEARSTAGSGWTLGVVTRAAPKLKVSWNGGKTASSPFDIRRKAEPALSECPQCEFAGADLTSTGVCADCLNDRRTEAFMERTGCTRSEVQGMIDKGLITLRGPKENAAGPEKRREPVFAEQVPPLNPAGDPCTFTTRPGPLLRRGNVKQTRTKKKPDLVMT